MASEGMAERRAAILTMSYLALCVALSIGYSVLDRIDNAESQGDEALSKASEALDRVEQNENDMSELQDRVGN